MSANANAAAATWRRPVLLAFVCVAAGALATTAGPLRDVDVFWHVRLGGELLNGTSIYDVGRDWSYAPVDNAWVSTQWIVEVVFSWLNSLWGWNGLVAFRAATTAATFATIAWVVFPRTARPTQTNRMWAGLVTACLGIFTVILFAQERPQQVSFILLPLVGLWWLQAVRDGKVPRWWMLLLLTAVWANCHGLWVMLPFALGLAFVGRWLDGGRRDASLKPLAIAVVASLAGGCVSPVGPLNLLSPIRFAGTTSQISEWEPTSMVAISSLGLTVMLVLFAAAWARGRLRPKRSEVLFVIFIVIFGAAAGRNVTPAVLLLSAALAWRLSTAWSGPNRRRPAEGLLGASGPVAAAVIVVGLTATAMMVIRTVAIPPDSRPVGLVMRIAETQGSQRVLNGYDVSGLVIWYARPAVSRSVVQVGIDGRADRYGATYIDQYLSMERGRPGWEETVQELRPTVALLPEKDALVPLLQAHGWHTSGTEAEYVLLTPPEGAG